MSYASIQSYTLNIQLPDEEGDAIPYEVISDGVAYDSTSDDAFIQTIRDYREDGIMPVVAVFIPKEEVEVGNIK